MLYLVIEHYDNGEEWEDHYDSDTVIGVFETKEKAEKEIECVIEEVRKGVDTRNKKLKSMNCPDCENLDRSTCTECFNKFVKIDTGCAIVVGDYTVTLNYSVKEIELNKRIK